MLGRYEVLSEIERLKPLGAYFTKGEYKNFISKVDSLRHFRRATQNESVYHRDAMDHAYIKCPMLIKNIECTPETWLFKHQRRVDSSSYQRDTENPEWIKEDDKIVEWLRTRSGEIPRYWVEDDLILEKEIKSYKGLAVIITDDIRLCNKIAFRQKRLLYRIPCVYYYYVLYFLGQSFEEIIEEKLLVADYRIWEDTGSLESAGDKYFVDGEFFAEGHSFTEFNWTKHWSERTTLVVKDIKILDMINFPKKFAINGRNYTTRSRVNRSY